jgi:diguanylate cyclase (GGDEF)-like protein
MATDDSTDAQSAGRPMPDADMRAAEAAADAFDDAIRYLYEALDVLRTDDAREKLPAIMANLGQALRHVGSERDRELEKRREVETLNAELARLNADLQHKMIQIEALQAQLAIEVLHDPLTQLFNRRYLDSVVPGLIGSAERRGSALSLALVDLDHFKLVNDRYGHTAGDAVLREIGRVLPMALRPADIVCRYGGEEFCVVLPDADATGAQKVLASLAARLRDLRVEWNAHSLGGFTFSAGAAVYGVHGTTLADLLGAADRTLYEAKDAGRNRVHVAHPT